MILPVRLQLSRKSGFNLQAHSRSVNGLEAVNCARPSKMGSPCKVGMWRGYTAADAVLDYRRWVDRDHQVRSFEGAFGKPPTVPQIQARLRGKNLACWCDFCEAPPCHVDVLLALANAPVCEAVQEVRT
jgi:hypothetical protein